MWDTKLLGKPTEYVAKLRLPEKEAALIKTATEVKVEPTAIQK